MGSSTPVKTHYRKRETVSQDMSDWALSTDSSLNDRQFSGAQIYFAADASRELVQDGVTAPAYGDLPLLVPLLTTWYQKIMAAVTLLLYGTSWMYLWIWSVANTACAPLPCAHQTTTFSMISP